MVEHWGQSSSGAGKYAPRLRDSHEFAVWETGGVDGCKVQLLQLEARNYQLGSDKMILEYIFTAAVHNFGGQIAPAATHVAREQHVNRVQNRNLDGSWGELK